MTISLESLNYRTWVAKSLNRRTMACLVNAIGCLLAAGVVLWLTWWAIHAVVWFILLSFAPSPTVINAITGITWLLLFAAYAAVNRPRVETQELVSPAKLRVAGAAAILADSPFFALTGPPTQGTLVRVVSVIFLVGPGMVMTSWKMFRQAIAGFRSNPDHVAEVLQTLATAGARVSLEELTRVDSPEKVAATFQAVHLFDGVVLRSSEPVGLVLTDSFRNELLAIIPKEKQQFTTPKPPAGRAAPSRGPTAVPSAVKPRPKPRS